MKTLGDWLYEARLALGETLRDAADATGVSRAYLSAVENGDRIPQRGEQFQTIISHYGLDYENMVELAMRENMMAEIESKHDVSYQLNVVKTVLGAENLSSDDLDSIMRIASKG